MDLPLWRMVLHKTLDKSREARVTQVVDRLRRSGFRVGHQRLKVLRQLISSPCHPSVDSLYVDLAIGEESIGRSTIYKTLGALRAIGEVLVIESSGPDGSRSRFDGYRPTPHPHLVCWNCGDISDLETSQLEPILAAAGRSQGRRIDEFRIELFSICSACEPADRMRKTPLIR